MIKREREKERPPSPSPLSCDPDQTSRRFSTSVRLHIRLFSSPIPLDLSSAYLWTVPLFFPGGDGSSSIDQKRLKTLAPVTRYANIFTAPLHLTAEINDSRGREEGIVDEDRDVLPPRKSFVTGRDQRVT